MRQTLFYIPHEMFGIPVFGLGWALGGWVLFSLILLSIISRRHGWSKEVTGYLPLMGIVGVALYALLPNLEVGLPGAEPLGLPIRGYGMFVLLGIIAGMSLSIHRAKQIGMDPEVILSLAFWLFAIAIAGARSFYVIQKWNQFQGKDLFETVGKILKFTEGGLVVYGAVIGGILALLVFSQRQKISMFQLGDVIAPGMAIGLALGRIGCLMNGCCYGGVCEGWPLAITFPKHASVELRQFSPPYGDQLAMGELHGFRIASDDAGKVHVAEVETGGPAEQAGLTVGTEITHLNGHAVPDLQTAQKILAKGSPSVATNEDSVVWSIHELPPRSRPVQPTQIYSSINAAILCAVVWFAYPFRRRDGDILLLLFGLYSITRFLLEAIRTDEAGQFGTSFTISQLVSLCIFALCVGLRLFLMRRPKIDVASAM